MKLKRSLLTMLSLPLASCAVATTNADTLPAQTTTTTTVAPTTTVQATTTTTTQPATTTIETTTTVSIAVDGYHCPDAMRIAYTVGWPEEELPWLDKIVNRESRCDTTAHNTADPATGSRGLTQINGFWCRHSDSWLQQQGILTSCDDLFDPYINLTAALAIWNRSGRAPWGG